MAYIQDISTHLKAKQFEKAANLLKLNEAEVGNQMAFKLLRYLASQLKSKATEEDQESINSFLQICCSILRKSQDPASDEKEFTQGVLSFYHLVNYCVNMADSPETVLLLSRTLLSCLQKFSKSSKDVESIAANSFTPVWSASSKMEDKQLCLSYQIVALSNLVHGGCNYWKRLMDRLMYATQDASPQSLQLAKAVFDELVSYCNNHKNRDLVAASTLLQVWAQIVNSSNSPEQHEKRGNTLKLMVKELPERKEINWLMELIVNVFGADDDNKFEVSAKQIGDPLAKELEIAFVRIVQMILYRSSSLMSQASDSKSAVRKNHISTVIGLLLLFVEMLGQLESVVETQLQLDPINLKLKCLQRVGTLCCSLFKVDPSRLDFSQTLFQLSDQLLWQNLKDQSKAVNTFLSSIEATSHNIGVTLYQKADYAKAATFFRKALEYLVKHRSPEHIDGEGSTNFVASSTGLYDSRKMARDWAGALEDFVMYLTACYVRDEASGKVVCRFRSIQQHFLVLFTRFKRDVHAATPPEPHLLEITTLDLIKRNGLTLDSNSAWEILHEELQYLDRRKGLVLKTAIGAAVRQAAPLAKTSLQKGISSYFTSREGSDPAQRHAAAKAAVSKLSAQTSSLSDAQSQGWIYLALSYLELFVSHQDLLKQKTEEEMASLGPLIQSSTNVEAPPGEDGSNVASDGTSVDAVSYSYLKLELELKNQEWMVKCLSQWEELVHFGWRLEQYSAMTFNCLKSLGYYFNLVGNSYFSVRAWSLALQMAESANSDEEGILACSELLKLGRAMDSGVLLRYQVLVDKKTLSSQEQVHFHLSLAWSKYYQHEFGECWEILQDRVFNSTVLSSSSPSKSGMLLLSQANLLLSLLVVVPVELSQIDSSGEVCETGAIQAGVKAAQNSYTAHKCYLSYAQQQSGWDFYGQEWHVLRLFLVSAVHLARLYLYTAAPREARFFLKEALNAAQKHVSVIRTAEALLELCGIDLILDNTMDCQSKLVLICHLMGMAPPVIPESIPAVDNKKPNMSPSSPVEIRSDRRKGYSSKVVPEAHVQYHQDANHRSLLLPFNHQGASPITKTREVVSDGGIFPEHSADCTCIICTSELVVSIRCTVLTIQAKLWSILGFQDLASEEFLRGDKMFKSICSRLRNPMTKAAAAKTATVKRLFDVPDTSKVSEAWQEQRIHWFQPAFLAGLELFLEHSMHLSSGILENRSQAAQCLLDLKSVLYEMCTGPIEYRLVKLITALHIGLLQLSSSPRISDPPPVVEIIDTDDDILALDSCGHPPKTPALGLRKPLDAPPPRRVRRNLLNPVLTDTITIEDDEEDSDSDAFSRRRLGKPQKAILYDSDSDVLGPTPPGSPLQEVKERSKRKTARNVQATPAQPSSRKPSVPSEGKTGTTKSRGRIPSVDDVEDAEPILPERRTARSRIPPASSEPPDGKRGRGRLAPKPAESEDSSDPTSSNKTKEKRVIRSRAAKTDAEVVELSSRLSKLDVEQKETAVKESRPKRTTRSAIKK